MNTKGKMSDYIIDYESSDTQRSAPVQNDLNFYEQEQSQTENDSIASHAQDGESYPQ